MDEADLVGRSKEHVVSAETCGELRVVWASVVASLLLFLAGELLLRVGLDFGL